jgi:hypothetical protein
VKHYAINTLCASTDKHRSSSRDKNGCMVEKKSVTYLIVKVCTCVHCLVCGILCLVIVVCVRFSIELCKEIADGLRIFFDFALPVSLLYASEQRQYEQVIRDMSTSALTASQ